MSKRKTEAAGRDLNRRLTTTSQQEKAKRKRVFPASKAEKKRIIYRLVTVSTLLCLLMLGVMANKGWLPRTDPLTGKQTGWFGSKIESTVNLDSASTLQLAKEYIYAGSRLLAVEDAGAATAALADIGVWRPSSGTWYVMSAQGLRPITKQWGMNGDVPTPGDYDGDGMTDFCVYRPSNKTWYPIYSSDNTSGAIYFGSAGDKLVQADYDGDGKTDMAVYRPSNGTWYIRRSSDQAIASQYFGLSTDTPTPADFDGDGKADYVLWRDSAATFFILRSTNGQLQSQTFGQPGDKPVVGDYDGDGRADAAVWRGAGVNQWKILLSATKVEKTVTFGDAATDVEVQKDYDGDGKTDMAVWRRTTGMWYILQSSINEQLRQVQWGQSGDTPVPFIYKR